MKQAENIFGKLVIFFCQYQQYAGLNIYCRFVYSILYTTKTERRKHIKQLELQFYFVVRHKATAKCDLVSPNK